MRRPRIHNSALRPSPDSSAGANPAEYTSSGSTQPGCPYPDPLPPPPRLCCRHGHRCTCCSHPAQSYPALDPYQDPPNSHSMGVSNAVTQSEYREASTHAHAHTQHPHSVVHSSSLHLTMLERVVPRSSLAPSTQHVTACLQDGRTSLASALYPGPSCCRPQPTAISQQSRRRGIEAESGYMPVHPVFDGEEALSAPSAKSGRSALPALSKPLPTQLMHN